MSSTNGTTVNPPVTAYEFPKDWDYYQGKVASQKWVEYNQNKDLALELTVELTGRLSDPNNGKSAIIGLNPVQTVTALLKFPNGDVSTIQKTVKRLRLLGYTDNDLERLKATGKRAHSFVGVSHFFQASAKTDKGISYFYPALPKVRDALTPEQTRACLDNIDSLFADAIAAEVGETADVPF